MAERAGERMGRRACRGRGGWRSKAWPAVVAMGCSPIAGCGQGNDGASEGVASPRPADATTVAETGESDAVVAASQVMTEFIEALERNDGEAALALVLEPSEDLRRRRLANQMDRLAALTSAGAVGMAVVDARVRGRWALVVTRLERTTEQGDVLLTLRHRVLYRPDSASPWRFTPERVLNDPQVQPLIDADYEALHAWYTQAYDALLRRHVRRDTQPTDQRAPRDDEPSTPRG